MIVSDLSRGLLVLLIPLLAHQHIAWLYLIVFLNSSIGTFFMPAYGSVVPEMASDEELTAANSMISISSFGSTAVGFAASGLLAAYSLDLAFFIDGYTFFLSALFISGVIIPQHEQANSTTNLATIGKNLQDGVNYLFSSVVLRSLVMIAGLYALMAGMTNTLLLPFAKDALNASTFEYGLQEGFTSLAYVVGSLFMARYAGRLREGIWISAGLLGMGAITILYSYVTSVPLAIILISITGFMHAPYAVAWVTLLQRNTERDMRGRVLGVNMAVRNVLMLLGMVAAGLADLYGPRTMMQITAYVNLAIGIVALLAPGIGRPDLDWVRNTLLLRKASSGPLLPPGRPATMADIEKLIFHLPALAVLNEAERVRLAAAALVLHAAEGTVIIRKGDISDALFFVLERSAFAGRHEKMSRAVVECAYCR